MMVIKDAVNELKNQIEVHGEEITERLNQSSLMISVCYQG